jgi:hypothetical protein
MSRSTCATVLFALIMTGCRLAGDTSPTPVATESLPSPSISAPSPGLAISVQEAIEIASDFRLNPDTVFDGAASGPLNEVAPTVEIPRISLDQLVWAVTFEGDVDVGCEFSDCPKAGTETVFIDLMTGEILGSQTYSPED